MRENEIYGFIIDEKKTQKLPWKSLTADNQRRLPKSLKHIIRILDVLGFALVVVPKSEERKYNQGK